MSAAGNVELGGFERRLLTELRAVVADNAAATAAEQRTRQAPAPSRRQLGRSPRWSLVAGLAVAAVACGAALVALSAGSSPSLAQAFPILHRPATGIPATLASFLRSSGATPRQATLDVRHARRLRTPLGTGYVLTDRAANVMCVAAPGFDRDWGAACGTASVARRQGAGGLVMFGGQSVSFVEVLPRGATATLRTAGGPARSVALRDGVLAFVAARATDVTTQIDGRVTTVHIPVPTRPKRMPVPARAQVVTPVRLRIDDARRTPMLSATFRVRYPARRGLSAYALEIAPLTHRGGCQTGDAILNDTTGTVPAGRVIQLRGGAPTCPGSWRVTVFYAAPTGAVRYPGMWPQGVGTATVAPKGSGEQIVATRVITVPPTPGPTGSAGRGPRTSPSGGRAGPRASAP